MTPTDIEKTLTSIESLTHKISKALVIGDPHALSLASSHLRQGAVELSQMLAQLDGVARKNLALKLRLKKICTNLASHRESLIRQSGVVERSLNMLIPASRATTYDKAASPYGAPGKSSGTFNFMAI